MIPNVASKIAIRGIATIGTAVTSLTTYNFYGIPVTIGEELNQSEGLNLLETDSSQWQSLVDKYKKRDFKKASDKIRDLELSSSGENLNDKNKQELQHKCMDLWNTKISTKSREDRSRIKTEIKNWCVTNPKILDTRQS